MLEYLYIFVHSENDSFKIGITQNIKTGLKKIESGFGSINPERSTVFSCENRKLVENIKSGLNAYLDNHSFHPANMSVGSTDWFNVESLQKCSAFVDLYLNEIPSFKKEGNLAEYLDREIDYGKNIRALQESGEIMNIHSDLVQRLTDLLDNNVDSLNVAKVNGCFEVSCSNIVGFEIGILPEFAWVRKESNKLLFDIQICNQWKKSRTHTALRGLIEIKFFNEFTWNNYKSMMDLR